MPKAVYSLREKVWVYPTIHGMDGWHFVNISKKASKEIKAKQGATRKGFGSVPVTVTVGKSKWKTSIFPDKKSGGYILPLKAAIRKKERIVKGMTLTFKIEV